MKNKLFCNNKTTSDMNIEWQAVGHSLRKDSQEENYLHVASLRRHLHWLCLADIFVRHIRKMWLSELCVSTAWPSFCWMPRCIQSGFTIPEPLNDVRVQLLIFDAAHLSRRQAQKLDHCHLSQVQTAACFLQIDKNGGDGTWPPLLARIPKSIPIRYYRHTCSMMFWSL